MSKKIEKFFKLGIKKIYICSIDYIENIKNNNN